METSRPKILLGRFLNHWMPQKIPAELGCKRVSRVLIRGADPLLRVNFLGARIV